MPCMFPGPHPGGKFRRIWPGRGPRPTPKGEVEGIWSGGLQVTRKGEAEGNLAGVGSPGPHLGGLLQRGLLLGGVCSWRVPGPWRGTPQGRLLLRAVRILLECILVIFA